MSSEKKKNSLLRPLLKSVPGTSTGPPRVHAVLSNWYSGGSHCGVLPRPHCCRRGELVAVQGVIPLVIGEAAVEVLGATAGHDGNRRAGAAPVLRLEVGGLDADLGDRVERRRGVVAGVRPGVLAGHTVVREIETAAAAVDRQAAHAVPARRLAVGRIHDARQELQVAGEVAALQGDVVDFSRSTRPERAALVVCTSVASAWTVTCSLSCPTSSVIVRSARRSVAPSFRPCCS